MIVRREGESEIERERERKKRSSRRRKMLLFIQKLKVYADCDKARRLSSMCAYANF